MKRRKTIARNSNNLRRQELLRCAGSYWRRSAYESLEERALLTVAQDLFNEITPYQQALNTAVDTITSLPLIGKQLQGLQDINTILQNSLTNIENTVQSVTNGHFQFAIPLTTISHTFPLQLGLDALLQLQTTGGVNVAITPTLNVGFDLSNGSVSLDDADTNIDLGLSLTLPNFSATGSLDGYFYSQAVDKGTQFNADFKFGFDSDGSVTTDLSGDAKIALGLSLAFVNPATNASFNPQFNTTLKVDWSFNSQTGALNAPQIEFDDFSLDADSFIHGFLGDVVTEVQKFTKPLQPIVDVLAKPVPILSSFDSNETIGDLFLQGAGASQDQVDKFNLLTRIITAVDSIDLSGGTGGAKIDFGTITVGQTSLSPLGQLAAGFNFDTSKLTNGLEQIFNNPALQTVATDLEKLGAYAGVVTTGGLEYPLIDDPATVIGGLLIGQPENMFTFSTGRIYFDLAPSYGFGIKDVFGVFLQAGVLFDADLSMGYDSAGLIKLSQDPQANPVDLLHGFYFDNSVDTIDPPVPNVAQPRDTGVYLEGLAEFSASAGVTLAGGLYANLAFELANNSNSSHVYLDTMISDIHSPAKVFNASGAFYAAASIRVTIPNPVGPDITLFDYELGRYDLINDTPPPPVTTSVPLVVINSTTQHTLDLDPSKMPAGSTVTVQPVYNFSIAGGHSVDGIRVDYPNEIDLYVEREDSVTTDFYNLLGVNGVANGVTLNITDPFRVFKDDGVPNPAPTQTTPAVVFVGGSNVTYRYNEQPDGTHPHVLLAGGGGYNTLDGGTMEFGNYIPAAYVSQAQAQLGDESGFDPTGQSMISGAINGDIAPSNPAGIIGATLIAYHGGLMFGGPGSNSLIAGGAGIYQMIGGAWVNTFNISPSFADGAASYSIDAGSGNQNSLIVRVPAGDMADFESGTQPDKYNPAFQQLNVFSNAGLFVTADGIQTVTAYGSDNSTIVLGDTSELNITFNLQGSAKLTFGGSPGPDTFNVTTSGSYYGTPYHNYVDLLTSSTSGTVNDLDDYKDYVRDFAGGVLSSALSAVPWDYYGPTLAAYYAGPVYTITRIFSNGRTQTVPYQVGDVGSASITLDGRGGSDTYNIGLGVGSVLNVNVKDSDPTTLNALNVNYNDPWFIAQSAALYDNELALNYVTPLLYYTYGPKAESGNYRYFYTTSVGYSPQVNFSDNAILTFATTVPFGKFVVDRASADEPATVDFNDAPPPTGGGLDQSSTFSTYWPPGFGYDPLQAQYFGGFGEAYVQYSENAMLQTAPTSQPEIDVQDNSAGLTINRQADVLFYASDGKTPDATTGYGITPVTLNVIANSGTLVFNAVGYFGVLHTTDKVSDTVNITDNFGSVAINYTDNTQGAVGTFITGLTHTVNILGNAGSVSLQNTFDNSDVIAGVETQVNIGNNGTLSNLSGAITLGPSNGAYGLKIDDRNGPATGTDWIISSTSTVLDSLTVDYANWYNGTVYGDSHSVYQLYANQNQSILSPGFPPFYTRTLNGQPLNSWTQAGSNLEYVQDGAGENFFFGLDGYTGSKYTPVYSVTGLPPGLSIDPKTGFISGTVAAGAYLKSPYQSTVTVKVGPASLSESTEWDVQSSIYIYLPSINAPLLEGQKVSIGPFQAQDNFSLPLTFNLTGLPPGLTFNQSTNTIVGTVALGAAQNGPYHVVETVTDGTDTASYDLYLSVTGITAPTLPNQIDVVGDKVSLSAAAASASGTALVYTATGLPTGVTINAASGLISGTIGSISASIQTFNVDVTITSGKDSGNAQFVWTVLKPGVTDVVGVTGPGPVTNLDGDYISQPIAVSSSLGAPLSVSATGLPPGVGANAFVYAGYAYFQGIITAGADAHSPYHVVVTATDGRTSASTAFDWSIVKTNSVTVYPPYGPVTGVAGQAFSTQVSGSTTLGTALTYSATGLPSGVTIDPQSGSISGNLGYYASYPQQFNVRVNVSDGTNTQFTTFPIVINGSYAPNVVNLLAPDGKTIVQLDGPSGTTFDSASISSTLTVPPASGVSFPFGYVSFALGGVAAGGSAVVSILNLNTTTITGYSQYGPTADNSANHWYAFPYDNASNTGLVISGNQFLLHLTDGGRGDTDGATNGVISDLGGPTVAAGATTQTALASNYAAGSTYGQKVHFTATVTSAGGTPTGTVQFAVDGHNVGSPQTLVNGVASLDIAGLTAGDRTVGAVYANSDSTFQGSLIQFKQHVNPAALTITADNKTKVAGVTNPLLTFTPNGFVNGDTTASLTTQPTLSTTATTTSVVGNYTITATGAADPNYTISYVAGTLQVTAASTKTTLSSNANPSLYGQQSTFSYTVAPTSGGIAPTGTVTFTEQYGGGTANRPGVTYSTVNGALVATLKFNNPLGPGSHTIKASYSGDSIYPAASSTLVQTVSPMSPAVSLASSANPLAFGQLATFTLTVPAAFAGGPAPNGTVLFTNTYGGATQTWGVVTYTHVNGNLVASVNATGLLNPGLHSIKAVYSGDNFYYASATATVNEVVSPIAPSAKIASSLNPSTYGQPVTVSVTLGPAFAGAPTPKGTVLFTNTYGGATQTWGVVTYTHVNGNLVASVNATGLLNPGLHLIKAVYSGDNFYYASATATVNEVVSPIAPSAKIASSLNPSTYGQPVTVSVTLGPPFAGAPTPKGTVLFTDTSNGYTFTLGSGATIGVVNGNLVASIALPSSLSGGTHTIKASYSGDNYYYQPISVSLGQVVARQGTTTAVTTAPNPAVAGKPVTLTATVAGVASTAGTGLPTGKVTFYDGTTNLGSGTLASSGGKATATLNVASLPVGSNPITAVYAGDTNYLTSTSPDPEQIVLAGQLDVNGDGAITPIDALQVINYLNNSTTGSKAAVTAAALAALDVNGDEAVTPIDALIVINYLNSQSQLPAAVQSTGNQSVAVSAAAQSFAVAANFTPSSESKRGQSADALFASYADPES